MNETQEFHYEVGYSDRLTMLPQTSNDLSLEQHLDRLSQQFLRQDSNYQDEIRILDSHISMSVDSNEFSLESDCDKINISLPSSFNKKEYLLECLGITESESSQTGINFMQRLSTML